MTEVWSLGGPVAAPAASHRIPISTAPNAGGYLALASLLWIDASGKMTSPMASANYQFNFAASNPARGIIGDFANNGATGLTGCQWSFTQNTINNWVIGQPAGVDAFAFWAGRNGAADGTEILRLLPSGLSDYADDAAASAGGVPIKGLYRTGSIVKIRVT